LIQTFVRLLNVNTGFRAAGVLTMEVTLPRTTYPDRQPVDFFARLVARRAEVPGVESVAATSSVPLAGTENLRQVTIEGKPKPQPGQEIIADFRVVTSDYFRTMGIPHLAGDPLPRAPQPNQQTLVINSMMADTCFAGQNPIGRRIKLTSFEQSGPWYTIMGIVGHRGDSAR